MRSWLYSRVTASALSSFPGYSWLFPTGTNSANVGIGMLLQAWSPTKQQLGQFLAEVIQSDPAIRFRLAKAKVTGKIVGWPLATFNPQLPIIGNRVALIGDPAGLINPLTGEGIQYALRSARWSAEALRDPLASDSLSAAGLGPYARRVKAEMRYDMALSRLIIDFVRNRAGQTAHILSPTLTLRATRTNNSPMARGLPERPWSGSGTSIFRIATSARIRRLPRCWRRRSNSPAYRALSSLRQRMTRCAMKARLTAAS